MFRLIDTDGGKAVAEKLRRSAEAIRAMLKRTDLKSGDIDTLRSLRRQCAVCAQVVGYASALSENELARFREPLEKMLALCALIEGELASMPGRRG